MPLHTSKPTFHIHVSQNQILLCYDEYSLSHIVRQQSNEDPYQQT